MRNDGTVAFKYFVYFNAFRYASECYKYPSVILLVCKIWRLVCARAILIIIYFLYFVFY